MSDKLINRIKTVIGVSLAAFAVVYILAFLALPIVLYGRLL